MEKQTTLYRHFDIDGKILYAGVTFDLDVRMKQHKRSAKWFSQIHSVTTELFESREEAEMAEKVAIESEVPAYNVMYLPPKQALMDGEEFREIRLRLSKTQSELAKLLDYGSNVRISEFERGSRAVPRTLALLMRALDDGYWPEGWGW